MKTNLQLQIARAFRLGGAFLALLAADSSAPAQIQHAWTRSYVTETFAGMTLDGQSNLCLTGTGAGDFVTLKYSPGGSLIWSNRYDGGSVEEASALAAAAGGQVWVSGITTFTNSVIQRSAVTIQYSAGGSLIWTQRFHTNVLSAALALDGSGNSYVAGALSGGLLFVVKYSPDGDQLWTRTYLSAVNWYMSFGGLAIDRSSNAILLGLSSAPDLSSRKNVLVKFDSAGNLLWSNEVLPYVGGGGPSALTVDQDGQVFVSGNGLLAAKFSPEGELNWTRTRTGPRPGFTFANLQTDPAGNLIIAGSDAFHYTLCKDCGDSATDYYLIPTKISPDGSSLWSERSHNDYGFGHLQFDADASCYLGGSYSSRSDDPLPPHADTILAKYAPNGAELWRTNFSPGRMAGMKVDGAGNIYLVMGNYSVFGIQKFVQPQTQPVFRSQPQARSIIDGDNASFTVGAAGFPSPVFQWRFNGAVLSGETNDTLFFPAAGTDQAGDYTVVLSNRLGAVTSVVATLTVNLQAPTVAPYFVGGTSSVLAGTPVTICSGANGGPKPFLQWRLNGTDLPGQTNACLALGPVQLGQSGNYEISASNSLGFASAAVFLSVRPLEILFTSGQTAQSVAVGGCVQITSSIGLTPPFTLQWQRSGLALDGQTNAWLYRCPVEAGEGGFYTLVVSNSSGAYTSAPIELTLYYAPPALAQPQFIFGSASALVGEDVSLSASYAGSPSFIQWRFNGADLLEETNGTLALLSVTTNQAGQYSFTATNLGGSTTSSVVTITVNYQPPVFSTYSPNQSVVEGTTARFPAYARGGPPPAYFLERNGTNVAVPFTYVGSGGASTGGFSLFDTTFADAGSYRILASNYLGVATSTVATLTVTVAGPLDRWTQRNPLPQSQPLLHVAHGTNQFVAVGERGTILTSPDGSNWALQNRRADVALSGVAYGDGLFVAIGGSGTILSSSDGTNWAYRYTAPSTPLNAVTYGNGRFVAVGSAPGLTTLLLHSSDGIDWERIPLNGFTVQQCVAYGDGRFIAAGTASIMVSTDGTNWALAQSVAKQVESVTFADGHYVAVGDDGSTLVSADGLSWISRTPLTTRRLLGVAYGAGRFVAAGARGNVLTSTDTITWTAVPSGTPDRLETIDFSGGTFVAAGENGTIIISTNGTTWTKQNFGITRDLDGMDTANGLLVVVGKGGNILTSTDGAHYTAQNAGVTNDLHGVTWGGGLWVAVGEPGIVLTSSNALNWTSRATGTTNSLKDATYADGQWIVVGTQGTIVRSTDGVNWAATFTNPAYDLNDVAYGNGVFIVAGDGLYNENGSVFRSMDGLVWTQVNYNPRKNLRGITFADGLFLIPGNDGLVSTTTNGLSFDSRSVPGGNLRAATWAHGLWIVVGNDGRIFTSSNLVTWTPRASRTFENQHQVALLDGHLVVIGNRGGILQSGRFVTELKPPEFLAGVGLRLPIEGIINQVYQIQASTNLLDWTRLLTFTNLVERTEFTDASALHLPLRFYRLVEQ